ncbi:MAG: methyltransferase [Lentisphaerae bacterium]|nr:methyltransferase [Lentisphaerota bacterium]
MRSDKDLYRRLRVLAPEQLWTEEVPRFNRASPRERMAGVAVIRAVGVAFAGTGTARQKADVRAWLVGLLHDPAEKIRRYAMAALPKIGAGPDAEREVIGLLKASTIEREKAFAGRALDKIGGAATLEALAGSRTLPGKTEQKVRARVARQEQPGAVRLDRPVGDFHGLRIHLRCRRGLEELVREEAMESIAAGAPFRLLDMRGGCVALEAAAPFALADLFRMRCFGTAGFVLGLVQEPGPARAARAVAAAIVSPRSRDLLGTLTDGPQRYRLDFVNRGHQRAAVQNVANLAYAMCPDILNDPRRALWSVDLHESARGISVELRPRLSPDPRMFYRTDDVAAASHPPLAACMARLAGTMADDVVWDPFCGSGLELVERALRGGVRHLFGSDISAEALAIAQANLAAAKTGVPVTLAGCDFRRPARVPGLMPGGATLVITNPPLGRRIRLADPTAFFTDFFATAARVLRPGGRLVFTNPLRLEPRDPTLSLAYRRTVDLGGFDCRLEVWRKTAAPAPAESPPVNAGAADRGDASGSRRDGRDRGPRPGPARDPRPRAPGGR